MNKKGFVLIETLVVTMFVLLTFSILYSNAVPLLGKYKEMNFYNGIDTTYDLYHVENFLQKDPYYNNIFNNNYLVLTCNNETIYNQDTCNILFSSLEINQDNDELIFLKAEAKNELINDENISKDVKDYLKTIEFTDNILILQKDGYISYVNINPAGKKLNYDFPYISLDEDESNEVLLKNILLENINYSICNPVIEDYSSNASEKTIYFSGDNECVNFNYVWYSGKLWRVVAINSDGTIKMITNDPITSISFGSSADYKTSWIYQWLNEDFLDTLYNYKNIIVQNASWDASWGDEFGPEYVPEPPSKYPNKNIVSGNVGLLNKYEYYKTLEKLIVDEKYNIKTDEYGKQYEYYEGYLENTNMWLLNRYDFNAFGEKVSDVFYTDNYFASKDLFDAAIISPSEGVYEIYSVRPVVVLRSDILTNSGNGSINNPYRLKDDIKKIEPNITKLNTRVSGEYVIFNDEVYRIIDIENNVTKLISYKPFSNENGEIINKYLSSSINYDAQIPSNDYWDYYLNNTWYNNLPNKYRSMLVKGTYYLGKYTGQSYKSTICKTAGTATTKACAKTTSKWTGYVGLPRIGEIFATSIYNGRVCSNDYIDEDIITETWALSPSDNNNHITFSSSSFIRFDYSDPVAGTMHNTKVGDILFTSGAQPTITISQDVVITSGTGRSPEAAFRIALPD